MHSYKDIKYFLNCSALVCFKNLREKLTTTLSLSIPTGMLRKKHNSKNLNDSSQLKKVDIDVVENPDYNRTLEKAIAITK